MGRFRYRNTLSCFLSWDIAFLLLECIAYFEVSCRMSQHEIAAAQPTAIEQTAGLANPTQPYELGVKS
jgi:hypothetical protein